LTVQNKKRKIMKKIIIGMLTVASFIFTANAQEMRKMKHHQRGHQKVMILKELNLTATQKEQMKANRDNVKMQLTELNKNENITVKEYKARKADILKSQKAQMDNVLTTEQKNKLKQQKNNRKGKQEMYSAKRMDKMKTNLGLSDEQVNKLKVNREATMAKAKAIKENSQLSQSERKEQLVALRQDQKNSLKQVLTPEQINKMEEKKKARMDKAGRK